MTDLLYGRNAVREALRAGRKVMRLFVAEAAQPVAGAWRQAARPQPPTGPRGGPVRAGKGPGRPGSARPGERLRSLPVQETRAERRTVAMAGRAPLEEIVDLAHRQSVPVERLPGDRLDKMTNGANHQGVAALAAEFHYTSWATLMERITTAGPGALVLILDSLQDPQNFGTLLRTAEAVGVTGVVMPEHRSVGVTPAVCNSSSGAVEYLRISQVTNLARAVEELKEANVWTYALAGDDDAQPYTDADLRGALALVVGSEGHGVSALVRKRCDGALALPMHGRIASLNASVAGSVVLYEALRQRRRPVGG
ncbi:MAG: 23S rRNA (guanosine(2251)-2'-O)-methyltransferase RlmB [Chloroflexia bacterium]